MQPVLRGAARMALFALGFGLLQWTCGEPFGRLAWKVALAAPSFAVVYGLAERWRVGGRRGR